MGVGGVQVSGGVGKLYWVLNPGCWIIEYGGFSISFNPINPEIAKIVFVLGSKKVPKFGVRDQPSFCL